MGFPQVDNGPMDLFSRWRRRARPAVVALALAALTAVAAPSVLAAPEPSGPEALAAARAEAARRQREVDKLDVRVETLAEAHSAARPAWTGSSRPPTATRRSWSAPSWPCRTPGPNTPATSA